MKITKSLTFVSLVIALIFGSCSQGGNKEQSEESKNEKRQKEIMEDTSGETDREEEQEDFNFVMPSALQITSIFTRNEDEFSPDLVNSLSNVNSYVTKERKLFNLGVYTSDLCYAVLNNQSQLSIEYLRAVKTLSEDVGMAAIFNSGPLFERFEKNIGNRDSIIYIMADLQEQTDLYVKRSDQEHLAMVIFAGAWTEGLYIGLNSKDNIEPDDDIVQRIIEQMTLLSNLIKGLEVQPNESAELKRYAKMFKDLRDYFENLEGVDLEMFEYDLSKITDKNLEEIRDKINQIRKEIVKVNS